MNNIDSGKEQFLNQFGDGYGYPNAPKNVDEIRATEFKRLDGLVYLDHAGATLYSELQMEAVFKDLTTNVYGNPHSLSESSLSTSDIVREARQQVLDFFNASATKYKCIFTSGATAAFKLVGEAFPWSNQSTFMYTMENHNSVLGIREYALDRGATALAIDLEEAEHDGGGYRSPESPIKIVQHPIQRRNKEGFSKEESTGCGYNLFAFPSECNFSGSRFSPNLVNLMKDGSERVLGGPSYCNTPWMVLIDAAKGCTTESLDLSKYQADFVVVSFYKLFGYPSGLGALVVRTEAARLLKKKYFSGGTVAASIADIDFVKRREGIEESFEDGTISFLSISSILHGFKILKTLTMPAISRHTATLATYVRTVLLSMRHQNGSRVCYLYGNFKSKVLHDEMGPIVTFNLKRPDGSWFGFREVEKLASLSGIQLRTGCFCNPGACAKYLNLSHSDLLANIEAGHICWDDHDILNGKPTGAVRVSFGYMSTFEDAQRFINFIASSFVSKPTPSRDKFTQEARSNILSTEAGKSISNRYHLRAIAIYPIKSCGGFRADRWPLSSTGLLHDREWLLKSLAGDILTQKKVPEMCFISTSIDLNLGILLVESPRCKAKLQIRLEPDTSTSGKHDLDLYAQRYEVRDYDNDINSWFSTAVGRPCILLRRSSSNDYICQNGSKKEGTCRDIDTRLSFVNEAQFLLISEESVSNLNCRLRSSMQEGISEPPVQVNPMRFRPNLVVSGGAPFAEDEWRSVKIGNKCFVSLGGCNRCQMINLNPQEGKLQRSREPLATLASFRRVKGKIFFGVLLRLDNGNELGRNDADDSWLQVGEEVLPDTEQT